MTTDTLESLINADGSNQRSILLEGRLMEAKDFDGVYLVQNPDTFLIIPSKAIRGKTPDQNGVKPVSIGCGQKLKGPCSACQPHPLPDPAFTCCRVSCSAYW